MIKLDDEYTRLADVMAEGERDEFSTSCLGSTSHVSNKCSVYLHPC